MPDIPTEKDVLENGIELGKMNALLLKKIEELTLYVIELKKKLKSLNNKEIHPIITKIKESLCYET